MQTCWAAMCLMYAKYPYAEPIEKAIKLVMSRQRPVTIRFLYSLLNALTKYDRMDHGHKKRLKVFLTKHALLHIRTSSFHFLYGC